jgi:hypothetical protein
MALGSHVVCFFSLMSIPSFAFYRDDIVRSAIQLGAFSSGNRTRQNDGIRVKWRKKALQIVSLLIVATTRRISPCASEGLNSGVGVRSAAGNKSGPAVTPPLKNPSKQSSGYRQGQSKFLGLPGKKSGLTRTAEALMRFDVAAGRLFKTGLSHRHSVRHSRRANAAHCRVGPVDNA